MKLLKTLCLFVLSTSVFFTGCIGDDLSDCPTDSNLTLAFSYLNFPNHISRVTVGIYNEKGLLVESRQVEKNDLNVLQGIALSLPAGSYTAVCWGNAFDKTQINGFTSGDDLSLHEVGHPGYFTQTKITTNDALYHGLHTFSVKDNETTNETVPFTPAYIRLVVQIKGLASTAPGAPTADYPYISVNDLMPTYDYQMITSGNPTIYYPSVQVNAKEKQAEAICDVLRFKAVNPITIDVMENTTTNNILHTVDLQAFIAANSITITDGKEVVIPILVTFDSGLNVTVTLIENWGSVPVNPNPQQ